MSPEGTNTDKSEQRVRSLFGSCDTRFDFRLKEHLIVSPFSIHAKQIAVKIESNLAKLLSNILIIEM